jgi:hypothetical protein
MASAMTDTDVRTLLRRAAVRGSDSLAPERKRRIVRGGMASVAQPVEIKHFMGRLILAAAGAAALAVLALLPGEQQGPASPVRDLSVTAEGGHVVLSWRDGGVPRKVIRATSRQELASRDALPARTVSGEMWVDREPSEAPIVYYVVE